jgi:hypothetical protein
MAVDRKLIDVVLYQRYGPLVTADRPRTTTNSGVQSRSHAQAGPYMPFHALTLFGNTAELVYKVVCVVSFNDSYVPSWEHRSRRWKSSCRCPVFLSSVEFARPSLGRKS